MFRRTLLSAAAVVMVLALHSAAKADPIVTASITNFSLVGNQFTFTVNNTSSTGTITALGFDLPGGDRGTFMLSSASNPNFTIQSSVKVQAGAQTASTTFDFALLTGNNFGGGKVNEGVGAGTSATFIITGDFSGMTAQQVAEAIFLRFQGIGPRDESIVIKPDVEEVPEPATMLLLGTGLAGVAAKVRKRRKAAKN